MSTTLAPFLAPALLAAQTTVTGLISDPGGNPATGGTVTFVLSPTSSAIAFRVAGTSIFAPRAVVCQISPTGQLLNEAGTGPCLIWGNPAILPANTTYTLFISPTVNGSPLTTSTIYGVLIFGATYDLSNIQFAPNVEITPQQTVLRADPVEANLVPITGHVFNLGSAQLPYATLFADNVDATNLTITNFSVDTLVANNATINNNLFATNIDADTITSESISAILYADQFPGADAGAKILATLADPRLASGGTIDCRGFVGAQTISSQILITRSNLTFLFGNATFTLSGVVPQQTPTFIAAVFQVNGGHNVWFVGTPGQTVFRLAVGETANVFTYYGGGVGVVGGGIVNLELDGNKANNTAGNDDTFQSGIHLINSTASGATENARITIDNCNIHDFNHYGIVFYGYPWASANIVTRNRVHDNGKSGDPQSTGDGIYVNWASSYNWINGNWFYNNLRSGIHITAVANSQFGNVFANNWCYNNTINGIFMQEQTNLGSVAGQGQIGATFVGNHCFGNTQYGMRIANANNVGFIKNFSIVGNEFRANGIDGIIVQGNNDPVNFVGQGVISDNIVIGNTGNGINVTIAAVDILVYDNIALGNGLSQITTTSGTAILQTGNKTAVGDTVIHSTAFQCSGQIEAASYFMDSGGTFTANQSGVRSWTLQAAGGNFQITSGDSMGLHFISTLQGMSSSGPIQPASTVFANRPGFGTRASFPPQNGMIISITDSTVNNWGQVISVGGGADTVLAWYNSAISNWTVIGQ